MASNVQARDMEHADVFQTHSQATREANFTAIFGLNPGSRKRAHSTGVPLTALKKMNTNRQQAVQKQPSEAPQQSFPGQENLSIQILEAIGNMNRDFISRFTAVEKSMSELEKSVNHRIDSLISDIKTSFSKEVCDVKTELKGDIHRLESEVDVLKVSYADAVKKADLPVISRHLSPPADLENNFVVMNLPFSENELVKEKVEDMLSQDLGLPDTKIATAKRMPTRSKKYPGVVVATCTNLEEKSSVMANKYKLARSLRYPNVYINNDKSRADRRAEKNLKTLVRAMADDSIMVRNGLVVNKNITALNASRSTNRGVSSNNSSSTNRTAGNRDIQRQSV